MPRRLKEMNIQATHTLRKETIQMSESGNYDQAIATGLEALAHLGVHIDASPSRWVFLRELSRLNRKITMRKLKRLEHMSEMTDERTKSLMDIYLALIYPAMRTDKTLWQLLFLKLTWLNVKYGVYEAGVIGLVGYGEIIYRYLDEEQQLAILYKYAMNKINEKITATENGLVFFGLSNICPLFDSWDVGAKLLEKGINIAGTNDSSIVHLLIVKYLGYYFTYGRGLNKIVDLVHTAEAIETPYVSEDQRRIVDNYRQFLLHKSYGDVWEKKEDNLNLEGAHFSIDTVKNVLGGIEALGFEREKLGLEVLSRIHANEDDLSQNDLSIMERVFEALLLAWLYKEDRATSGKLFKIKRQMAHYVKMNPDTYGHLYKLVEGCYHMSKNKSSKAQKDFEHAILLAQSSHSYLWQGIGCQLLSIHYTGQGAKARCRHEMVRAADAYKKWGHQRISEHLYVASGLHSIEWNIEERWGNIEEVTSNLMEAVFQMIEQMSRSDESPEMALFSVLEDYKEGCQTFLMKAEENQWMVLEEHNHWRLASADTYVLKLLDYAKRHEETVTVNHDRQHKIAKYTMQLLDSDKAFMAVPFWGERDVAYIIYMVSDDDFAKYDVEAVNRLCDHTSYRLSNNKSIKRKEAH